MDRSPPSAIGITVVSILILGIAIALRAPSCYESFWVDELHTAWTIWGTFGEVTQRAKLGHQSPFYFVGLWAWKHLVGNSEFALRLSSVLATALSSVVLVVGITRWTGSVLAGTVAGMLLATETNALFFGTELRPYAIVIFFGSIALILFLELLSQRSRDEARWKWFGLNTVILLSVLCQPTAAGLILLPATLLITWLIREPRKTLRFNLSDAFILLGSTAVLFSLWNVTLNQSWQNRSAWSSFASATDWHQIYRIWNWTWLWMAPLSVTGVALVIAAWRRRFALIRIPLTASLILASLALLMTVVYWWVSWMNWVPVWHRRYFVSALPMFACLSGISIAVLQGAIGNQLRSWLTAATMAMCLVVVVPVKQGVLQRLPRYPVALVVRGEDWRSAIRWVRSNSRPNDLIYLDAGLIENKTWLNRTVAGGRASGISPAQSQYLTYPGRGPYDLDRRAIPIDAGGTLIFGTGNASRRIFAILRKPASQVKSLRLHQDSNIYSFGNVTVVVQTSALDRMIL